MNKNLDKYSDLNILCDANLHIKSFNKCKKGSIWKESVQRYEMNLLKNINNQITAIQNGTYEQLPFNEFTLNERGKIREIKATHIDDRVVLGNLCDNILIPKIAKYLIYDNGASLKGKGVYFTRKRFETHLHKYYRKHGNEGYILLMDFTKFFDNIRHDKLLEEYKKRIKDNDLMDFLNGIIDAFRIDVSYLNDEEYKYCLNSIYNALEYAKIDKSLLTGEKLMEKSVGIGSQISQISGLLFPSKIDNYCKIVKGLKYYGRYMDDTYIIHESKEYLQQLLSDINKICDEYGIFINHKKTQIVKLTKTFIFLKTRYNLTDTGKVIKRINKDSVTRERRKLKKFRKMLDNGTMTYADIEEAYRSWRGSLKYYSAYHVTKNMDELFNQLFINSFTEGSDNYGKKNNGYKNGRNNRNKCF